MRRTPMLSVSVLAQTPHIVVCAPPATRLAKWQLQTAHIHIPLPDSTDCATIDLPDNAPALWQLLNPHGMVIAEIDVAYHHCLHDMSTCRPSATATSLALHVDYRRATATMRVATLTPPISPEISPLPTNTTPPSTSTIPLGMLLMLGGWMALKILARPTPDVLYSETGEDAASSADSLPSESRKV